MEIFLNIGDGYMKFIVIVFFFRVFENSIFLKSVASFKWKLFQCSKTQLPGKKFLYKYIKFLLQGNKKSMLC